MIKKIILGIGSFLLILAPISAHAQLQTGDSKGFGQYLKQTFGSTYVQSDNLATSLPTAIGNIISLLISFIGVILLVLLVWAGFLWLTAGGNEEQVAKAKQYIKNGVIGIVIVLSAYVITQFVVDQVDRVLKTGSTAPATGTDQGFDETHKP